MLIEFKVNLKLSEHKNKKMAPVRRSPVLGPVHKTFEVALGKETGYLSENVPSEMHICPIFGLGAFKSATRFSELIMLRMR